jgi:hypothetical protein
MSAKYGWPLSVVSDDLTLVIAIIGAMTGIFGVLLGLFNFLLSWRRDRVRLKVKPVSLLQFPATGGSPNPDSFYTTPRHGKIPRTWGIEVTNKGTAIKLKEVGYLLRGTSDKAVIAVQFPGLHVNLPFSLATNDSVTIYGAPIPDANFEYFTNLKCAFASVTTGKRFTGNTKEFRALIRKLK